MQEDFLHFIWKYKKFDTSCLESTNGALISIINLGQHNHNSGPDFFNSLLEIDTQKWAGNVEIHLKSSDWYVHNHEKDEAYDNVILHVVWEHDTEVFRKDNSVIPTLELKAYVNTKLLQNYKKLILSKTWINCENDFNSVDDFTINNWLERLYIERLERKSKDIYKLLDNSKNDWEAVFFKMLCKNFGLKVNGETFMSLANATDFSVIRKVRNDVLDLEALFFGQANLLVKDVEETYLNDLEKRYQFLKQKFQLNNKGVLPLQFFRLRPPNFPTIRLSQLAMLFFREQNLFSKIIDIQNINEVYTLFQVETSKFWESHYTFSKSSKSTKKRLTKSFIDLLLINTIIPIKFSYAKSLGKAYEDAILDLIKSIKIEKNSIVDKFLALKDLEKSAMTSQGLIQLKTQYCDKNKCLQCAIGNGLVVKNK
ncbi:MAG: DUF2851 family protein [Winogradskyella sp.]|uniref:DUF2851 family protein n=1 Tax=Winogradskyella sp. TaxID=1883156 RepID=UPI0017AF80B0|nr:DUF2851 family protein [Winogradskyella sp.]MBT8243728.1 DUF2851 family protein [Winogradskyella sp.]NNK22078.1 DUF2851 family protein [Winogradskyella sp.]